MKKKCEICDGKGYYQSLDGDGFGGEVTCDNCQGQGFINTKKRNTDE